MNWETIRTVAAAACVGASVLILFYLLVRRLRRRPPAASGLRTSVGIRQLHAEVADLRRRVEALGEQIETGRADALREAIGQADERIAELRRLAGLVEPQQTGRREGREGQEILRLSRQGLEPVEIARRMKMPVGEIELVLHLERSAERQ